MHRKSLGLRPENLDKIKNLAMGRSTTHVANGQVPGSPGGGPPTPLDIAGVVRALSRIVASLAAMTTRIRIFPPTIGCVALSLCRSH